MKHFFSICALEYFEPEEVTLIGDFDVEERDDGNIIPPRLSLYRRHMHSSRTDRKPHLRDFLVPFVAVKDHFACVMEGWHKLARNISPARSLYFSSLYGNMQYIESTFLSLVQSAEVFHRRTYGGTYISQAEYETKILPDLKSAIPEFLQEEVRNSLSQRLVFLNEYTLAKRLKLMIRNHRDIFEEYVPKWSDKIKGIVMARNFYTHYSSTSPTLTPDFNDLVDYVDVLRLLMELEMMTESGVNLGVLHEYAKKSSKYRRIFHSDRWNR